MTETFHTRQTAMTIVRRAVRQHGVLCSGDAVASHGLDPQRVREAFRALERRGEVIQVGRGVYQVAQRTAVIGRSPLIAVAGVLGKQDYYISWWFAMAHHGLTEQLPRRIAVAVSRKRRSQTLAGYDVRFVRVAHLTLEGTQQIDVSGVRVCMATPEQAVLDSLDRLELGGGPSEVVKALVSGKLHLAKLIRLARAHSSERDLRRLGYLLSVLGLGHTEQLAQRVASGPYALLDSRLANEGSTDPTWRICDNIGRAVLQRWAERDT